MNFFVVLTLAVGAVSAARFKLDEKKAFASGRIANGHDAKPNEAPYLVSLKATSHFCGGAIIHPNWVITAAHCMTSSRFSVIAGLHTRNNESTRNVQIRQVKSRAQLYIHDKYDGGFGPYDIGVILLHEPFDLNAKSVGRIPMAFGNYSVTGSGKIYGWKRASSSTLPNELQRLDVDIVDHEECKAAMPVNDPIKESNVCSYTAGGADGSCHGDSGGPLVHCTDGECLLIGVATWRYVPCAFTKKPSVYTKVSAVVGWMKSKGFKFD